MPDKVLADLRRRLDPLTRKTSPLSVPPPRSTRFGSLCVLLPSRYQVRFSEGKPTHPTHAAFRAQASRNAGWVWSVYQPAGLRFEPYAPTSKILRQIFHRANFP